MPAISFNREFLDALLGGTKQQTTRKQTARIKVGDAAQIYIEQRAPMTGKPVRVMTGAGTTVIADRVNNDRYNYPAECPPSPFLDKFEPVYYAHILGEVRIIEVFDFGPCERNWQELEAWAWADGFPDFASARCWFETRYGARWMHQTWTVIRWAGWTARYFEPNP